MSRTSEPPAPPPGENPPVGVKIAITFECQSCHQMTTRLVSRPGSLKYCEACAASVKQEKTRARVARHRANDNKKAP